MPSPDSGVRAPAALPPVRSLAVASGKGGVGKTSVSVNLSVAMSRMGYSTLLLDTDLGLANVDVMLGLTPRRTLADVMSGYCSTRDALLKGPEGLLVLPAVSGRREMAELRSSQHVGLVHAVSELDVPVSHLVVDNAAGIADGVLTFCQAAHEVVLVVCDDPMSLTDSYALIKVLSRERGVKRMHVLTNRVEDDIEGRRLYAKLAHVCEKFLDVSLTYLGHVPQDPHMMRAIQRQQPVVTAFPSSPAARAFVDIAERVACWAPPVAASGHVEFFMERLLRLPVCAA
jgi:flagellar biosynthesis protein FlhG